MTKPVRLLREARLELLDAARWYGDQDVALRQSFLDAVDEAIERARRLAPHLGIAPGTDPELRIRRVFVRRFPYSLYFVELPTHLRVLAFAHARRRPIDWSQRR
ncbi:MAG: type II toxin-antitoxin system RelE/ParE family toxin [Sandaracinus sp.]|nr:type II toxin-antitoxin system RelE/ParE family toxin [Sandaracinus sp.]